MNPPVAPPPFWPKALPTEMHVPRTKLWENLEIAARRYPDKPAYRVYGQVTSFTTLWRDAQRLAGWLQQRCGVKRGDRVLLSGQSSTQFVTAYQAILRAGAVVVPVNSMYLSEEFAHLAEDSGARVLITAQELWPRVEGLLGRGVEHAIVFNYAKPGDMLDADTPDWFRAAPAAAIADAPDARVGWLSDALAAGLAPAAPALVGGTSSLGTFAWFTPVDAAASCQRLDLHLARTARPIDCVAAFVVDIVIRYEH